MLIICEGKVTEPEYFARLRSMAIDGGIWAAIEIRPKPKEDRDQPSSIRSPHKSLRPKRKFILVTIPNEVDPIEEKYDIHVPHDPLKPYTVNPFTNVDTLVQRLLGEEQEIAWGTFDQPILWNEIAISASISNNTLVINFNNLSKSSRLINGSDIAVSFSTAFNHFTPLNQTAIISPNEQKEITVSLAESTEVMVQIQYKRAKLFIA